MITPLLKKSIAYGAFEKQDLGKISVKDAIDAIINKHDYPDQKDYLTAYVVESVNNATDIEDIETDLNYAINQLQKAKEGILFGKLTIQR